jgi:hypothetical protein
MNKNSVNIYAEVKDKLKNTNYRMCNVCGTIYYYRGNKSKHERSLKHKYAEYVNKTMFEITRMKPSECSQDIVIEHV